MSLNRAEWVEMWNDIKTIELAISLSKIKISKKTYKNTMDRVKDIKDKIQYVIGQME